MSIYLFPNQIFFQNNVFQCEKTVEVGSFFDRASQKIYEFFSLMLNQILCREKKH